MSRVVVVLAAASALALLALAYVTLRGESGDAMTGAESSSTDSRQTEAVVRRAARQPSPSAASHVVSQPRLTLAERRAVLPEWDEGDGRIAWLDASELTPLGELPPDVTEATEACLGLLRQLDDAVAGKRKLKRRRKRAMYRQAREALAHLSAHIDVDNPDELSLLEETRAQLMLRMEKLHIEPPVGG